MNSLLAYASTLIMLGVSAWAFWRGDKALRQGAAIIILGWFISPLAQSKTPVIFDSHLTLVDSLGFLALSYVSVTSRRLWSLFAAAFQLDAVVSHLAKFLAPSVGGYSYITGIELWGGYGLIIALLGGVFENEYERRKGLDSPPSRPA